MPCLCSIGNNLPSNNNNSTNLEVADTKCSKLRQTELAMSLCSSEAEGRCGAGHTTSHVKIVSSTSTTIALAIVLGSGLGNSFAHVRQLLCFLLPTYRRDNHEFRARSNGFKSLVREYSRTGHIGDKHVAIRLNSSFWCRSDGRFLITRDWLEALF